VNNARREQVEDERAISDLHGVAGVMSSLISDYNIETLSKEIYDLALALITPLGADHDNDFGHELGVRYQVSGAGQILSGTCHPASETGFQLAFPNRTGFSMK
jgi:hypothetical protein